MLPDPTESMPSHRPKGTLIAIGGAEDKEDDMVILRRVIDEVKGKAERVEVIAAASREPREAARPYLDAFKELGLKTIDWMALDRRDDVEDRKTLERLEEADIVYFTGGDQVRLAETLRGTRALGVMRERFEQGAVIAGTSAGAAAMSQTMLARGDPEEGLNKGNVRTASGLGLLPQTIIDTHFIQRGRFSRLMEAITHESQLLGLGISEDTALIVREGHLIEVAGSDNVIIVDGSSITHTNHDEVEHGEAMAVEGVLVHALVEGYRYDLEARRFLPPKTALSKRERKVSAR